MDQMKTVDIHDKVFEETYTAHIQRNGANWLGQIPDVPNVKCNAPTETILLKNLEKKLHEALISEEEEWEKRFEENVKDGKLDRLAEKAIKNYREGRYRSVDKLQKLS